MKTKHLALAFLCLTTSLLNAQSTQINLAFSDRQPAKFIEVIADNKPIGTTDEKGSMRYIGTALLSNQLSFILFGKTLSYNIADSSYEVSTQIKTLTIQLQPYSIEEILILAARSQSDKVISKASIAEQNTGRDLPVLMQFMPSVQVSSDAGNGVGYTGIRIRGSDASRTNITINGVPINDAESHGTYWVNMPDFASSVSSIQIQRGVGTSTNGSGAFGASVNIQTSSSQKAYATFSNHAGSFGTYKSSIAAGTGLINNHWTAEVRLSRIKSDGYIDRAATDLQSYYLNLAYTAQKFTFKLLNFGGKEKTYQAWNGIPIEKINGSAADIKSEYDRNLGYLYRNAQDSINYFNSDRRYNYYTYQNETDNYNQNHTHFYALYKINSTSSVNATLFYTAGKGYFEQYRYNDKLSKYNTPPFISGTDTVKRSDLIRRRWLDNTLTGTNINYNKQGKKYFWNSGISVSYYNGSHFGEIVWAAIMPYASHLQHYYNATGEKTDASAFSKFYYNFNNKLSAWMDLQYRVIKHKGYGSDNDLRTINFNRAYKFFNPKTGLKYNVNQYQNIMASFGIAQKEPTRSDLTDHAGIDVPGPEKLYDFELSWQYHKKNTEILINGYSMQYKNQLVLTGAVNDVGNPLRQNVPNSYRRGIELMAAQTISKQFKLGGNFTFSQNQIKSIDILVPNYVTGNTDKLTYTNVQIAQSPSAIGALYLQYKIKGDWNFQFNYKYVGKQYLDNTQNEKRSMPSYTFGELWVNKKITFKNSTSLTFQFQVLNLFNTLYYNNGFTYFYTSGTPSNPETVQEVFVFPQATRNCMGGLVLNF